MSLSRIRTNLQAQTALLNLNNTNNRLSNISEKLQTGKRINKAADDSAGFSIASKLRARVGGQSQALRNIGDAKSIMNVAEGGMNTIMDMLQQMKEKVIQGANDSNGAEERKAIRTEMKALTEEIQQTLDETTFNGNRLFTNSPDGTSFTFQVNAGEGDTFDVNIDRLSSDSMSLTNGTGTGPEVKLVGKGLSMSELTTGDTSFSGTGGTVASAETEFEITNVAETAAGTVTVDFEASGSYTDLNGDTNQVTNTGAVTVGANNLTIDMGGTSVAVDLTNMEDQLQQGDKIFVSVDENQLNVVDNETAGESLGVIDAAISEISGAVSNLGDAQNRLSFKSENLNTAMINNESARSQIEDADFAEQQVQLAKTQILQQTNVSALAQANAAPQSVLSLVG